MKYKVLKECVLSGKYHKVGDEYCIAGNGSDVAPTYIMECLDHGFLEPIKERVELSGQYIPAEGKKFWGIVFTRLFGAEPEEIDGDYAEDVARLGLSFKTKEECQKFIDWLEAYQILRQDTKGFKPVKSNGYKSYQVCWDGVRPENQFEVSLNYGIDGTLTFATREDAEASIKAHKKEWKTYLRVEEQWEKN